MNTLNDKDKAYAHWAAFIISNVGGFQGKLKIENFSVTSGKLHRDKDDEVDKDKYNGKIIGPGEKLEIYACGNATKPSGSSGKFDLVDPDDGNKTVRKFVWDCPLEGATNTWSVSGSSARWMVEIVGGNIEGGALGNINIDCLKKP
ncbi:hypothetical protein VNI00_010404 [Paramarasmius palmivorus]|uniref:Uncharacterized protein n=1 Tax=Paramarasmius palmivorus TaxID=297713 RepID=A0AAW0CIS4_9AGAR